MSKRKIVVYVPDEQLTKEDLEYTDHFGITYESKEAMCAAWGQDVDTYTSQYLRTKSVVYSLVASQNGDCVLYEDKFIEELVNVSAETGASIKEVYKRIREGWCPASAGVVPSDTTKKPDYLLMLYPPDRKKWRSWSVIIKQAKFVTPKVARKRLEYHWDITDAVNRSAEYNYTSAVYDTLGNIYLNLPTMLQAKGIAEEHYAECMEHELDRESCLAGVYLQNPRNTRFRNIKEICGAYDLDYTEYIKVLQRDRAKLMCNVFLQAEKLSKGMASEAVESSEVAKTSPSVDARNTNSGDRTDHRGITYNTVKAMCKAYNTSTSVYYQRKNKGMSMEGRLTGVEPNKVDNTTANIEEDTSNVDVLTPKNEDVSSKVTSISSEVVISTNETKDFSNKIDDLTTKEEYNESELQVKDAALDKVVQGLLAKRKAITPAIFQDRVEQGMTPIEAALVLPYHYEKETSIVDFAGHHFSSRFEMCEYYGITGSLYEARMEDGLSQPLALCTPFPHWDTVAELGLPTPIIKDHRGMVFESIEVLCETYAITPKTYYKRLRMGYPKALVLTLPMDEHYQDAKSILKLLDRGTRNAR